MVYAMINHYICSPRFPCNATVILPVTYYGPAGKNRVLYKGPPCASIIMYKTEMSVRLLVCHFWRDLAGETGRVDRKEGAMGRGDFTDGDAFPEQRTVTQLVVI